MEEGKVRSGKRGRTFSYDSVGSNMSSWGSTSASASDGSGTAKRRLSEEGMLSFRNCGSQKDGQCSDDDSISEGDEENWDSDNATADENSEMFGDENAMPDWSSDEEDAEATNLDNGGSSRSSSVITCRSPSVGVVSPFSPIMSGGNSAKDSRVRRRQAKRMNEIVDDLGLKVRKMNHNEYTNRADGMEYVEIVNKTPFRGSTTTSNEQSMSCGYISEASSSSRVSSGSRSSSRVGFEQPLSVAPVSQNYTNTNTFQAPAFPTPAGDNDSVNMTVTGGGGAPDTSWGIGHRSARFAQDITHSECMLHD